MGASAKRKAIKRCPRFVFEGGGRAEKPVGYQMKILVNVYCSRELNFKGDLRLLFISKSTRKFKNYG